MSDLEKKLDGSARQTVKQCVDCRKYKTEDCPPWPTKGPHHWCTQFEPKQTEKKEVDIDKYGYNYYKLKDSGGEKPSKFLKMCVECEQEFATIEERYKHERDVHHLHQEKLPELCECGKSYRSHFIDDSYKTCEYFKPKEEIEPEKDYLCLKLEKEIDICRLIINLRYEIEKENNITHPSDFNQDHLKRVYKWEDVAEALLTADGSWNKRPEFYHKYDIVKHKEERVRDATRKELIEEFLNDLKEKIPYHWTEEYIKKWQGRVK